MEEGEKGILRERWHFHFLFLALPLPFPLLTQPINGKGIFAPFNYVPCSVCLNFSFPALSSYFSCTFSSLQCVLILAFVYLVMLGIQIFYEVSLFCLLKALFPGEEERVWKQGWLKGWDELSWKVKLLITLILEFFSLDDTQGWEVVQRSSYWWS